MKFIQDSKSKQGEQSIHRMAMRADSVAEKQHCLWMSSLDDVHALDREHKDVISRRSFTAEGECQTEAAYIKACHP